MRILANCAGFMALMWLSPPLIPTASATTALYLSEVEQATGSDAVILAIVGEQRVDRNPDSGRLYTHTTLHMSKSLMGETPEQFEVHQMGGRMGEEVLQIAGDATLVPGEQVCVFVRQVDGQWYLTAMEQSLYTVVPSLDGLLLERELTSGLFLRTKGGDMTPWVDDSPGTPMTLDRLAWILADANLAPEPTLDGGE